MELNSSNSAIPVTGSHGTRQAMSATQYILDNLETDQKWGRSAAEISGVSATGIGVDPATPPSPARAPHESYEVPEG